MDEIPSSISVSQSDDPQQQQHHPYDATSRSKEFLRALPESLLQETSSSAEGGHLAIG